MSAACPRNLGAPGLLNLDTWERMVLCKASAAIRPYLRQPRTGRLRRGLICALFTVAIAGLASAQSALTDSGHSLVKTSTVEFLAPAQIAVPAGKPSAVELHFRIEDGFHINSHTPREAHLIPTTLSIPAGSGVTLKSAAYPPGSDYTLPVDPTTKLSVYTGEFAVEARILAQRGDHHVEANLHYQACDKSVCYPPKTVAVPIDVVGR